MKGDTIEVVKVVEVAEVEVLMEKIPEKHVLTRINLVGNTLFIPVSQLTN